MADHAVATIGLMLAGITVVTSLLAWPPEMDAAVAIATVGGGGLAVIAFSGARHGLVSERATGGVAAGGAGLAGVGSAVGFSRHASDLGGVELAAAVTMGIAVVGTLSIAIALGRGMPYDRVAGVIQPILLGGGIGAVGLYVAGIVAALAVLVSPGSTIFTDFALQQIGVGLGFLLTGIGFMIVTGRGVGYVDIGSPSRRDAIETLAGFVAILFVAAIVLVAYEVLDVPTTEHVLHRRGREEGPEFILLAIPFTWLGAVIGEELLYRNVVQKYLTEHVSATVAIVASSAIFALVHIPAYTPAHPVSIAAAVLAVFGISLVLAVSYHRTENVVVPMIIHGCYNVVVYVGIYLQLTTGAG